MKTQIENAIASYSADLKSQVKSMADAITLFDKQASQQTILLNSMLVTSLKQFTNNDLSGISAMVRLATRHKLNIKGYKAFLNESGIAQAIKKDSETGTYSFKQGFKAKFYQDEISSLFESFELSESDIKQKFIFIESSNDIFEAWIPAKDGNAQITSQDAILKLASQLHTLTKQVDLSISDLQTALMLAKYSTKKDRLDAMAGKVMSQKELPKANLRPSNDIAA